MARESTTSEGEEQIKEREQRALQLYIRRATKLPQPTTKLYILLEDGKVCFHTHLSYYVDMQSFVYKCQLPHYCMRDFF
jgi:hypothetical protein